MKLGEHLLEAGVIDAAQLRAGLTRAAATGERLGAALIGLGLANGDQVAAALAQQHGVPAARERQLAAAPGALVSRVPAELARRYRAVVVGEGRDRELLIALENPLDIDAIAALEKATKRVVIAAVASTARLDAALARLYPPEVATDIAAAARGFAERTSAAMDAVTVPLPVIRDDEPVAAPVDLRTDITAKLAAPAAPAPPEPAIRPEPPEAPINPELAMIELPPPEDLELAAEIIAPPAPSAEMMASPSPSPSPSPSSSPSPSPSPSSGITPAPSRTTTIPLTRRMPVIAGGTSLTAPDAAPASRLVTTAIPYLLGFAVMTVTAGLTYRQCTHDASWAIGPDYYSTYLRATLPLPGTGWRGHESLRMNRTNDGDRWARLEGFYRGGEVDDPGEALMVLRVHAPGMFPEEVDMEQFRGQIDTLSRQIVASAGDIQTAGLDCTLEPRVRTEPAGKCRGPGTFHSEPVEIYMFYWEDTVDDVMAVIYLAKGERLDGKVAELETFIHDIQVE